MPASPKTSRSVRLLAASLPLALAACGMPTTESDIKFAGVGLDPDEIGAEPVQSGGLVEYSWVEFAGAELSLSALGLLSFDSAGPDMVGFHPPYAIVNGTGFVFDTDLDSPDALFGSFARPPAVVGSCHTVFEPQSYLSNVADVGTTISIETEDGSKGFDINRRPFVYPPVVQSVFPYYSELASYRATPWIGKQPTGEGTDLASAEDVVLARPNYPFGETVNLSFMGGMPQPEATYGSIPVPLASAGSDTSLQVVEQPKGFMLEWTGPVLDSQTYEWTGSGDTQRTCLQYAAHPDAPESAADCEEIYIPSSEETSLPGQIYTGPWDTDDGSVTLKWTPDADTTDTLSVTVRILGAIDETESYFVTDGVKVQPDDDVEAEWAALIDDGLIPPGTPLPDGYRNSMACDAEDEVEWYFDPAFKQGDGSYIPTLQGDPLRTLAEVTCTLDPSAGEFTLTEDVLADALAYGDQHGGAGAVFYVGRTQTTAIQTPPVRDAYGQRRDISPITVVSKAVQVGRFWYDR